MSLRGFRKTGHPQTLLAACFYSDASFMLWVILGSPGPFVGEANPLSATRKGAASRAGIMPGSTALPERLAIKIENRFQGMDSPHKMKLATAGCPRNCSEAMVKDLGAVAVEGGNWEIYVGGAAGSSVRKGDILCVVDSHDDVLKYAGRFIQYYRENAKYLERTHGFVERVGIAKIRAVVVEDSEGIAARLEKEIEETMAAYNDPWKEAYVPATANHYASQLPVLS